MNKNFQNGQLLKYIGKKLENFNKNEPCVTFLGYDDSSGWSDAWVEYKGQNFFVPCSDLEIVVCESIASQSE